MKKKYWGLAISCLLILTLLASGCGNDKNPKGLTPEEISEKIMSAYTETKTYKMDLNINQEMTMSGVNEENIKFGMQTTGNGSVDSAKKALSISMDMKMNVLEGPDELKQAMNQQGTMKSNIYFINNTMYMHMDILNSWMKQELPQDMADAMWNQQDQMTQQVELLKGAKITVLKEETVDNVPCYVVAAEIDPEALKAQLEPQMQQIMQASGAQTAVETNNLEIKEYNFTYWVDKDSFFVRKSDFDATIGFAMTANEAGQEETITNEMKMTGTVKYYDLNKDVNITLPAEAENAQAMPVPGE